MRSTSGFSKTLNYIQDSCCFIFNNIKRIISIKFDLKLHAGRSDSKKALEILMCPSRKKIFQFKLFITKYFKLQDKTFISSFSSFLPEKAKYENFSTIHIVLSHKS